MGRDVNILEVGVCNDFTPYICGFIQNLNHFNLMHRGSDMIASPNDYQRLVHSMHFYPFVTVIEKAAVPVDKFFADKRGTLWQPFL